MLFFFSALNLPLALESGSRKYLLDLLQQVIFSSFRPYRFHYSNAGLLYYLDQKRILVKLTLSGRRQQFVSKWKTTSIFLQLEDVIVL
jgi:hypothetical protein